MGGVRVGLAVVRGRSMEPTLRDGDRLLVAYGARPRSGRVAVVRFSDGIVAVKRLDHTDPADPAGPADRDDPERGPGATWWVTRDNPREGRDSWSAGAVEVLAVVVGRVWPRPGVRL